MLAKLKGISPMIATVLLIAFTVAVGGIISLFMTRLTTTQTGEAERGAAGTTECAGVYINIINVTSGTIIVQNPSKNKIHILNAYDNLGTMASSTAILTAGTIATISPSGVPATTATKVTVRGYCENSAATANVSINGVCSKGGSCWPI